MDLSIDEVLQVEIRDIDDVAIITIDEHLDAVTTPELRDAVKRMLERGIVSLVVDLSRTRFLDSSGCGALVASLQDLLKQKGGMKLAGVSQQAKDLFQLTRLDRVFRIFDTVELALESSSSRRDVRE
jgi:anti-sigma B factor antagonist